MTQTEILQAVREFGPCTTMEVVRRVYGEVPAWRKGAHRAKAYNTLRMFEKYGEVSRTVEDGDAIWRCVE